MTKILNFTVKDILPALLSKAKTQTIRPAWHNKLVYVENGKPKEKPPRFKVGGNVKLLWNQRSKYKQFCKNCGNHKTSHYKDIRTLWVTCPNCGDTSKAFNKHLGDAEITEVFMIEMGKEMDGYYLILKGLPAKWWIRYAETQPVIKDIYSKDGFKSAEQMFDYFEKAYGLGAAKEFYVYRWRWLS